MSSKQSQEYKNREPSLVPFFDATADSAEADHRIANSLQLIVSLLQQHAARVAQHPGPVSGAAASAIIGEAAARIETIARLHRLLSTAPSTPVVDACVYLGELCAMLSESLAAGLATNIIPPGGGRYLLPPDKVLRLALITVEAVTNAIKYAHPAGTPATVKVSCRSDGTALLLEIADDGAGLPPGFRPAVDGGFGFRAMGLLAASLDAELAFDSSPEGLCCRVRMPLQHGRGQ